MHPLLLSLSVSLLVGLLTPAVTSRRPTAPPPSSTRADLTATVAPRTSSMSVQPSPTATPASKTTSESPSGILDKVVAPGLASAAGAAGGTWIVFLLQKRREKREKLESEAREQDRVRRLETRELRRVQFALTRRIATIVVLWNQWIVPALRNGGGHWGALQRPAGIAPVTPLSLERIEFVLERDPNLLARIHLEEERFQGLLSMVGDYTKLREEASAVTESKAPTAPGFSPDDLAKLVGPRIDHQLKVFSKSIIERCPQNYNELLGTFDEVALYVKNTYDGKPLAAVTDLLEHP